jgi:hypothetical protein
MLNNRMTLTMYIDFTSLKVVSVTALMSLSLLACVEAAGKSRCSHNFC